VPHFGAFWGNGENDGVTPGEGVGENSHRARCHAIGGRFDQDQRPEAAAADQPRPAADLPVETEMNRIICRVFVFAGYAVLAVFLILMLILDVLALRDAYRHFFP
jgi:hypothetical protein